MKADRGRGAQRGCVSRYATVFAMTVVFLATGSPELQAQRRLTGEQVCALVPPGSYEPLMPRDLDPTGRQAACVVFFPVPQNVVQFIGTKPSIRVTQFDDAGEAQRILEAQVRAHSSDTPVTPPGENYGERGLEWVHTTYNRHYIEFARGCYLVSVDWMATQPYQRPSYDPELDVRAALAGLDQRLRGAICPDGAGGSVPAGPPAGGPPPTPPPGNPGVPTVSGGTGTSDGVRAPTEEELEGLFRLALAGMEAEDEIGRIMKGRDPEAEGPRVAKALSETLLGRLGTTRESMTPAQADAVRLLELAARTSMLKTVNGVALFPSMRALLPVLGKLAEWGASDPAALVTFRRVIAVTLRLDTKPER
jgi:hypothetical protein